MSLVLIPAAAIDCTFGIQAVTAPDDRISGTFAATNCTTTFGGTVDLQRQ